MGTLVGALLMTVSPAAAQSSQAWVPRRVAGHPVFEMRVGVDTIDAAAHPYVCAEGAPLAWLSLEGCGTGSGFLHQGPEAEMAHFRARVRPLTATAGRTSADLLFGAGFAEIQRGVDQAGFRFGRARADDQNEAAGPEASVSVKGRLWVDEGGRTYVTADLNAGAAYIEAAPTVIGSGGAVVPFAAATVGYGF